MDIFRLGKMFRRPGRGKSFPRGGLYLMAVLAVWSVVLCPLSMFITAPWSGRDGILTVLKGLCALGVVLIFLFAFFLGLGYAAAFLQKLYAVEDKNDAFWRLVDMVFDLTNLEYNTAGMFLTVAPSFLGFDSPFIIIREGRIDPKSEKKAALKIGGPALLIIYEDSAVVLEHDGQFTRVLGPGIERLERFETVRAVVDLRRHVRKDVVRAMTKDGIPIRLDLEIEYQIQPWALPAKQKDAITPKTPYPFRESAVRRAVYNTIVDKDRVYQWDAIVWFLGRICLRRLLRQRVMDRLLDPEESDPQSPLPREKSPRWELQVALQRELQPLAHKFGATVFRVTLGPIQIDPESVKESKRVEAERQRIQVWQAEWQNRIKLMEQAAEAETMRLKEIARAQAQADMVTAIARGLPPDLDPAVAQKIIALRVLESLEEMAVEAQARRFLPEDTIRALRTFHQVLEEHTL